MMRRPRSIALFSFLAALLVGCSDATGPSSSTPGGPGGPTPVARIEVAPGNVVLDVGGTAVLTARPLGADGTVLGGHVVAWTSADTTIVAVSPAGVVTARRAGSSLVRATSAGRTGEVQVEVRSASPTDPGQPTQPVVAWIQITPAGGLFPMAPGTSRQLGVIARASNGTEIVGRPVEWSSTDDVVARVSATGLLEARAVGTAWVKAVVDGKRDSTLVSVPTLIARVETDPARLDIGVGDVRWIVASAFDAQGNRLERHFTWSSSNGAVATVDAAGRVDATGAGTALITATSEGKSVTTLVTVTGQQLRLTDAGGAPLPAILDTITVTVNGVAHAARFQASGGTLRVRNGRYELVVVGVLLAEGIAPLPTSVGSVGVMAYDVFTGDPLFFEGDEWVNRQPRFRGRARGENGLVLDWNRTPDAPVVTLGFAP